METIIESLLTGRVARLTDAGDSSAIGKSPATGPRAVRFPGIEGDEQADLAVHGGRDKAIHHYPRDHYDWWQEKLAAGHPLLGAAGAFGENISTTGISEHDVCIGDRFRLGTALVEICQGRQPCWKQAHRLQATTAVALMVKSGRTGWYYRVIEEGVVAAGDILALLDHPNPEWSVARVTAMVVAGAEREDVAAWQALAALPELAEIWRATALVRTAH